MSADHLPAFLRGNPLESHQLWPFRYPAIDQTQARLIVHHLADLAASGGIGLRVRVEPGNVIVATKG